MASCTFDQYAEVYNSFTPISPYFLKGKLVLSESYYLLKVNCVFNLLHLVLMKITTAGCDTVSSAEECT